MQYKRWLNCLWSICKHIQNSSQVKGFDSNLFFVFRRLTEIGDWRRIYWVDSPDMKVTVSLVSRTLRLAINIKAFFFFFSQNWSFISSLSPLPVLDSHGLNPSAFFPMNMQIHLSYSLSPSIFGRRLTAMRPHTPWPLTFRSFLFGRQSR